MTDKKKLDEAATLNVSTEQDGMTATTTFTADDLVGLAALLKNAGIESAQFNGAATLSVDAGGQGGAVSTMIQAPDLRSIMQLMEPEFQMAGDMMAGVADMGAEMEPEMVDAPVPAEVPMDAPESPVEGPMDDMDAVDATVDADGNLALADPEMDMEPAADVELEDDIEEEADYDYRDHDVHPAPYAGKASKDIVQPATKAVPARSGDNPIQEGGKSFADYVQEAAERNQFVPQVNTFSADDLVNEFRVDELSNDTKNRYFKKAADQINRHAHFSGMQRELGNHEMADKHDKLINKRAHGMNRAIAKPGSK